MHEAAFGGFVGFSTDDECGDLVRVFCQEGGQFPATELACAAVHALGDLEFSEQPRFGSHWLVESDLRGFMGWGNYVLSRRNELPALRRRIGVVFQDFRLLAHLSAYDNVALPLRVAGVAERELAKPVTDMLEWVGLTERMHARPAQLSGGEQQRVAIARAVIGRPELLVADEPTGNVDPDMAVKLLRLFEALNRLGTTVVVATHDVHLLKKVPDSLIMRLDKGKLSDPTGALRYPPRPRTGQG